MAASARSPGWLDRIERVGNALPDPTTLFLIGALAVMALSQVAVNLEWSVDKTVSQQVTDEATGATTRELVQVPVRPVSLLTADGVYWALKSMVRNFVEFPPLGVVLVGMLGIGVAERSGLIGAFLKTVMLAVPNALLTPTMVFVGVLSSVGLDAGYVVLPPVAAALYRAVGRSPLVGLAAVFAGVSAGFSANLMVTSLDPLLAGLSTQSAQILDPEVHVAATANLWFMIGSTVLLTLVGWAVTAFWVEPRFERKTPEEGGPARVSTDDRAAQRLSDDERRGLGIAMGTAAVGALLVGLAWGLPGAPLSGMDGPFPRWVTAIVPLLFLGFLLPGIAYGISTRSLRSDRDVADMMGQTMAGMGPYIVMAFFAAQFIAYFRYSGLGEIFAIAGGQVLARADLSASFLMVGFVGVVVVANLFIGSMSAKYAFMAPVFVPMFMQVGISPELTQVAYRVGDSVTNVITPLNPYMVIILVFMKRYAPSSGIGTLVALMLPYALAFGVAWSAMLVLWIGSGMELGPQGPLFYAGPALLPVVP
ncbi:MAG: AbgT family transporter [Proteobacteria bacterium]|nr:AbgT family transporter [Pseudomonadota bacterium]